MKLLDITHPLGNATAHWPGDAPFRLTPTAQIAGGSAVNLSEVSLSLHSGTHADAPYHYDNDGPTMAEAPLEPFIGPARVIDLTGRTSVSRADLQALDLAGAERVLIRTGSCPDLTRFYERFTYLEPEAVRYLAGLGVRLIGTDAHSVDPFASQDLPAHNACRETGVFVLENLNLAAVMPGDYELIALPLKLVGGDGSPVRAILRARI